MPTFEGAAGGIVMMLRGVNAMEIVTSIKARVDEINTQGLLPNGLQVVPFYNHTDLVDAALWTVTIVLLEGVLLVVIILFVFMGDVRSSLIVVATLIITPLITFIVMNDQGISANLMSQGGLAIAIALMVDSTVVVENVHHRLGHCEDTMKAKIHTIVGAVSEVG